MERSYRFVAVPFVVAGLFLAFVLLSWAGAAPAPSLENEEENNLEEQLRSLRARVESLRGQHQPAWRRLNDRVVSAKQRLDSVRYCQRLIDEEVAGIANRRRDLEDLAQAAGAAERDARANALRAAERARLTAKQFETAQAVAAACASPEDASRLLATLNHLRAEFGISLTELGNALKAAELYQDATSGYDLWLPEYQLVLSRFPDLKSRALEEARDLAADVEAIPVAAAELDALKPVADTLLKDLADAYDYYRKVNASRATAFDLLQRSVRSLSFYTTPFRNTHARLKDSPGQEATRIGSFELPASVTRRNLAPYPNVTDLGSVVAQAETEVNHLKLLMVGENRLRAVAADCGQAKPLTLLGESFGAGPAQPATPPAPVVPAAPPTVAATPPLPDNGLQILGLNRMVPGQHDRFTAADGFEQPYPGPVEWNSSVEDVVVVDRQTGDAVAFKPGKTVIIARRGDRAAYFNVTVDAVVGNFLGLTLAEAQAMASQAGLAVQPAASAGPPASPGQAGRIARQHLAPGARAPAGTIVQVSLFELPVDAQQRPDSPAVASGGFESLGGETRQVPESQPVEDVSGSVPESPADPVTDFFRGQNPQPSQPVEPPVQPQPDPFEQQRAEEEARAERQRQERENAMMNLLGVMAGASQQMNDLRNRRQGQASPAHTPPPVQSTWPNASGPSVYNPPGGSPGAPSRSASTTPPGVSTGPASSPPSRGCAVFPFDWRPRRSWERRDGRMVEVKARHSALGDWKDIPCQLSTAWRLIQEYECVRTGERRCQGLAR
jgi:hypothetical protein